MSTDPEAVPTRARVLRGVAWKAGSQSFAQVMQIVVAIVLARLLTPHDYGLAAMVLVFAALVPIFADLALGSALVQRDRLTEDDRSTVFWLSGITGLGFTLIGIALSWPIAHFYREPEVQPLFAVLSLGFVIRALGSTQTALLSREMNFRSLELRMIAGTAVGSVVGITVAFVGGGAWAIILQQVVGALVSTMLLWVFTPWRASFRFSMSSVHRLARFSGNVFGTRILFYLNRNADNLLVGRFLGPSALGAYALAYNVMLLPMSRIGAPVVEVFFPAFSRMQEDRERLASLWIRINRVIGALTIPAMLGLIVVAPEFVRVVFGEKWAEAIPVLQLLAWVGLLQSLQSTNSSLLMALDRTQKLLGYAAVALVASLVAFVLGLHWGIVGVAAAYAVASSFVEPYYTLLTARALRVSVWSFWRGLSGVAQAAAGMTAVVLAVRWLLPEALGDGARLAIMIGVGIATYVPLALWRAPEVIAELSATRRRRTESGRPLAPQTLEH
jgi:O-antigen/teichoic acid export membrane protein